METLMGYRPLTEEQRSLLGVIEAFRPDDLSPIAAALNVIINHAEEIKRLQIEIDELKDVATEAIEMLDRAT